VSEEDVIVAVAGVEWTLVLFLDVVTVAGAEAVVVTQTLVCHHKIDVALGFDSWLKNATRSTSRRRWRDCWQLGLAPDARGLGQKLQRGGDHLLRTVTSLGARPKARSTTACESSPISESLSTGIDSSLQTSSDITTSINITIANITIVTLFSQLVLNIL